MNDTMYDARIVGAYTTEQRRDLSHRGGFSLALEAVRGAADDAGIALSEIDGIAAVVTGGPSATGASNAAFWARVLGRPMRWAGPSAAIPNIADAAAAIDAGLADTIALVIGMTRPTGNPDVAPWARPDEEFTAWTGSYTAVQYALVAQRYLHQYGEAARYAMARASATIRNYGSVNPDAVFSGRGPFTPEDVLASRMIADPLTLLMCSSVNDGGAAIILTSKERAASARSTPIGIVTAANQQPYLPYRDAPVLDVVRDESEFATRALARAGVRHDDIDVVAFYDHFAIGVLMAYEMFGFCALGEAADLVADGVMEIRGRFPTCTDGGNQSFSHNGSPTLFRTIEGVRQLRGDVRDNCPEGVHTHTTGCRAVRDARTAFVSNPGPPTGGNSFMVLRAST